MKIIVAPELVGTAAHERKDGEPIIVSSLDEAIEILPMHPKALRYVSIRLSEAAAREAVGKGRKHV